MEQTHHLISRGKRHNMNRGGRKRRSAVAKHRRSVYTGVDSPFLSTDPGYDTVAGVSPPLLQKNVEPPPRRPLTTPTIKSLRLRI